MVHTLAENPVELWTMNCSSKRRKQNIKLQTFNTDKIKQHLILHEITYWENIGASKLYVPHPMHNYLTASL